MEIRKMSGPNENKPGKNKKKHGKGSRKAKPSLNQKPDQMLDEKPEPVQSHKLEPLASHKPEQLASREPKPLQSPEPEPLLSPEPEPLQIHEPEQLQSHEPEPLQVHEPEQPRSHGSEQLQSAKPEPCQDGNKRADPAVAPENAVPVDFQTLATAYGNYTKKSFEQTQAFVEKLSGVRSLDKAVEIQTEFAKQAYETFVAESQKIRELYRGLAKRNLRPFEGIAAKKTPTSH
jgi:phasin protein